MVSGLGKCFLAGLLVFVLANIICPRNQTKINESADERVLNEFTDDFEVIDPDCPWVFNGRSFDFPYIFERCLIHGIDIKRFSRDNTMPRYKYNEWGGYFKIGGRTVFDILYEVTPDQTLYGVKNRKLKTVAEYLELDRNIIRLDTRDMTPHIGKPSIIEYVLYI
ncbi:MAG: 3'-5' exonuclease [Candidatus Hodarchaeota archaeon]